MGRLCGVSREFLKGILNRSKFDNQETTLYVKSIVINKMKNLGISESKWITY